MRVRNRYLITTAIIATGWGAVAHAQPDKLHRFDIRPQELKFALRAVTREAGLQLFASADALRGLRSPALDADVTASEALQQLLAGTGLQAEIDGKAVFIRGRDKAASANAIPGAVANQDIIVTGTQIHGSAPIGAPLTVIDRKAIEDSGRATIAEYIQTLPQNYGGGSNESNYANNPHTNDNFAYGSSINLRGLGTESTLVLFDGNRPALGGTIGAFVDTSLIPTSAIDRLEILTDGASAIYGTDAVAGVVNVRFRSHFNGFETHLYQGVAGGALHQFQASQAAGKKWDSGGLFVAYQYDQRSRLAGDSRSYWTEDLTRWGGPDDREPYSSPGTLTAANGAIFAIPDGQNGHNLSAAQLLAGRSNLTEQDKSIDILPRQTTHSVYAAADQTLFGDVTAYARAIYTHRAYSANLPPVGYFQPLTVPTTNPFYVDPIGTGEPVTVQYDFSPDLGHYRVHGKLDAVTTSAGLKGRWAGWSFDVNGAYGRQHSRDTETNSVSATRAAIALADTNPATALNLFGDGTGNNPATLDFIRSTLHQSARSTVWSSALRIDGPLFDVPAGTVKLAIGAEHRHESFNSGYTSNADEASPDTYDYVPFPGTPGSRHIDAVYGELSIPILNEADSKFPGKLDASVAGRSDWYSDVGRTINPKAGLSWVPVPGLTLRGSWGTSFRAPTFAEDGGTNGNLFYTYLATDSHSPTGTTPVILLYGYSPDIKPEKATSWTAGFDVKPIAVPGLTVSATYFNIAYRDRIESPLEDLDSILSNPAIYAALIETPTAAQLTDIYASPRLANYYGLQPGDIRYFLNVETQNLARQNVQGIDFTAAYSRDVAGGTGTIDMSGTRLLVLNEHFTSTSPASNVLGTLFNPARLRMRGHLGWSKSGFSGDAFVNYTGRYRNTLASPAARVASWTTFDAQIGYRFGEASPLKGARLALSATNLTDRKPPYVQYSLPGSTFGYDPNQASAIGRQLSVDLTFQW